MKQQAPFPIPVNYFSIPLGLLSLGLAWRSAATLLYLPGVIGESILAVGALIWILFLFIYIYKWIYHRESALLEMQDMIQCCFISLILITTLFMGAVLMKYSIS